MKKLSFVLSLLVFGAVLFGCASPDHVAVTQVDEDLFPSTEVSAEELPFSVSLPEGWTVREEALLYTLSFDEGMSGYIQLKKAPVEAGLLGCRESGDKKYCTVRSGEDFYSVVVAYKTMSTARRNEADAILGSMME